MKQKNKKIIYQIFLNHKKEMKEDLVKKVAQNLEDILVRKIQRPQSLHRKEKKNMKKEEVRKKITSMRV